MRQRPRCWRAFPLHPLAPDCVPCVLECACVWCVWVCCGGGGGGGGGGQALLGCGKTLQSKISRHEFLDFCRRSPEIRSWVNYYDDPWNEMDKGDVGGVAGGAIGPVAGFSGMGPADARIPIVKEAAEVCVCRWQRRFVCLLVGCACITMHFHGRCGCPSPAAMQ